VEDVVGDPDLADVVQQRDRADQLDLVGREPEPPRHSHRETLHVVGVAAGVAVARLERCRERSNDRSVGVGGALLLALDVLKDGDERLLALEQSFGRCKRLLAQAVHAGIRHIRDSSGT
jgi:hypothetical protein